MYKDPTAGTIPENPEQLQKIQRRQREAADSSEAVYNSYQDAKEKGTQAQVQILGGIMKGQPLATLFLIAARSLADLTGNAGFYTQCREGLREIYAIGLEDPDARENEADEIRQRIDKLETLKAAAPPGAYRFIDKALRQHRAELERLTAERKPRIEN